MQYRDLFMQAGGEKFEYIPALNATQAHVNVLATIIREKHETAVL
jgi:ferrochelatase